MFDEVSSVVVRFCRTVLIPAKFQVSLCFSNIRVSARTVKFINILQCSKYNILCLCLRLQIKTIVEYAFSNIYEQIFAILFLAALKFHKYKQTRQPFLSF